MYRIQGDHLPEAADKPAPATASMFLEERRSSWKALMSLDGAIWYVCIGCGWVQVERLGLIISYIITILSDRLLELILASLNLRSLPPCSGSGPCSPSLAVLRRIPYVVPYVPPPSPSAPQTAEPAPILVTSVGGHTRLSDNIGSTSALIRP